MARPFHGIARGVALLTLPCALTGALTGALAAPAHAQGTLTAYLALKGAAQGALKGSAVTPAHRNEIEAISLTTSQPYGAATPVLHVVADIGVAPQVVRALVANEMLQTPTITFAKPGPTGTLQQVYQIRAPRGYVTGATITAAAGRAPTVAFDLLLSGGTTSTNEAGATTTAAPPSVAGSAPVVRAAVVAGEFVGQTSGKFPPSPNAPLHWGIILDSASIAMITPVINGATSGKASGRPLVIARPTSEDAAIFDAAQARQERFSDIKLRIYEPQPNGTLVDVFDIETTGACMYVGSTACAPSSGLAASNPGASAGLAGSGGGTPARGMQPRVLPGLRRMSETNDASTSMRFEIPAITLESRVNQTTVSYSFVQGRLD